MSRCLVSAFVSSAIETRRTMDDLRPNMSSSFGADNCPECTEAESGSQGEYLSAYRLILPSLH